MNWAATLQNYKKKLVFKKRIKITSIFEQFSIRSAYRQQPSPLLHRIIIWAARYSMLTERETNHNKTQCASVLMLPSWTPATTSSFRPFIEHQWFAVCYPLVRLFKNNATYSDFLQISFKRMNFLKSSQRKNLFKDFKLLLFPVYYSTKNRDGRGRPLAIIYRNKNKFWNNNNRRNSWQLIIKAGGAARKSAMIILDFAPKEPKVRFSAITLRPGKGEVINSKRKISPLYKSTLIWRFSVVIHLLSQEIVWENNGSFVLKF